MATIPQTGSFAITEPVRRTEAARVPWYIWCAAIAVTSVIVGGQWDISWHSSIGRDTFWTPAHMAIYLCGVLSGVAFGYLVLVTTFSPSAPLRDVSVRLWGFRAPLGAFVASLGGITMLMSAPFDNWWHNAYGLDVKIVSPPHLVLFIGIYGVVLGTMMLIAGNMNRSSGAIQNTYRWLFLYVAGILLNLTMVLFLEYTERVSLHTSLPYILLGTAPPMALAISARATGVRFAATFVAACYVLFIIGLILVLPLFPAEPKLGPVYQHVKQFIPPGFPILLIVPALALDLLWQRTKHWSEWKIAACSGFTYVIVLLAVEWPFASFLMTPAARNRFFGTIYLWYGLPPMSYAAQNRFLPESASQFWIGIAIAVAFCMVFVRWGRARGDWFRSIQR